MTNDHRKQLIAAQKEFEAADDAARAYAKTLRFEWEEPCSIGPNDFPREFSRVATVDDLWAFEDDREAIRLNNRLARAKAELEKIQRLVLPVAFDVITPQNGSQSHYDPFGESA